jgi:hypothetical protein
MRAILLLVLLLCAVPVAQPLQGDRSWYGRRPAFITVANETQKPFYVVIADRNQGTVDPGYQETFEVPYGEHRVVAEGWEKRASSYVYVSKSSPNGLWTVLPEDMR